MAAMSKGKRRKPVKPSHVNRVSPIKPGLRGARNWATAQLRAASYTRNGFARLTLSIAFVIFMIVFGALWLGGFLPDVRAAGQNFKKARLMSVGFVVDRIDVMGEGRLREDDIRRALGVQLGDYLFDLDINAAQSRVESLSWVDRAVVRRLWPDRIVVQIVERKPYALWQHDGMVRVVDVSGNIINEADTLDYVSLPLVVGSKAPEETQNIRNIIKSYPGINRRIDALIYVNESRWDLYMDGGDIRVKLPAGDPRSAVEKLHRLQSQMQILDRTVGQIDMRLQDRLTLTPVVDKRV